MAINCSTVTTWPRSAQELRSLLGITPSPALQCHGTTKKRQACKRHISSESASTVDVLLSEIAAKGSALLARELLARLARMIMCKQNHQSMAEGLLSRWWEALPALRGVDDKKAVVAEKKEEEEDQKVVGVKRTERSIKHEEPGEVRVGSHHPMLKSSMGVQKGAGYVKTEQPTDIDEVPQVSSLPPISNSPTPSSKQKIQSALVGAPRRSNPPAQIRAAPADGHVFEPYGASKSVWQLNRSVQALIKRPLLPLTETPAKGFIYVYTFPTRYRLRTLHLKIGYAKDVDERMARWRRKCGYEPSLLSSFSAELYVKIEKLVHAQLWNQRRREACCPACRCTHVEWFEVKETTASALISLWSHWSRLQPYDEDGCLTEEWRKRLDKVDLGDPGCWNEFVYGT